MSLCYFLVHFGLRNELPADPIECVVVEPIESHHTIILYYRMLVRFEPAEYFDGSPLPIVILHQCHFLLKIDRYFLHRGLGTLRLDWTGRD